MRPSDLIKERENIKRALRYTFKDLKRYLRLSPEEYLEPGTEEPSINIRLCVDEDTTGDGLRWIIRSGPVDFDPYHSRYCAASSVQPDTDLEDLLEYLIAEVLDQIAAS